MGKNPVVAYTKRGKGVRVNTLRKMSWEKRNRLTFFNWAKIKKRRK